MGEQKTKKERNAVTDKIRGRSSNAVIEQRKKICTGLYKINPTVSKPVFVEMLKTEYRKYNIIIPTRQTINSDFKKWGIDFKNPTKILSERTGFHGLGNDIHQKLRQIRIGFKTEDIILFDYEIDSKIPYDSFKETGLRYENKEEFLPKFSNSVKETIQPNTLFQLSIILKEKGLGEYIANIFDYSFLSPKPFLYSKIYDYCTIIVFEYKNYDEIMDKVYQIVEEYIIPKSK